MDGLDLPALRIFLEAGKVLNFTEAARTLNLSQPAVSMQIKALEDYLQVDLFKRNAPGLRLTSAGQALMPLAEQIVSLTITAENMIRATASDVIGDLVIACSATAGKYVLPHLLARFKQLYPDVSIAIRIVDRTTMLEGITTGAYDLGVASLRVPGDDLCYTPFFTDHLSLIAAATHPWARRDLVQPSELLTEEFICREPDSACRSVVARGLEPLGVDIRDFRIVMEVGSAEALAMAVEHGMGIGFASLLAAVPRLALGHLVLIHVEGLTLQNPIELVTSRARATPLPQMKFMEFLAQKQNHTLVQLLAEGHMV